ncbi:MAG: ammonium transporter [Chloroflexi bacterium]|nr:ammonium transporter [Chloroflexota bacterium]
MDDVTVDERSSEAVPSRATGGVRLVWQRYSPPPGREVRLRSTRRIVCVVLGVVGVFLAFAAGVAAQQPVPAVPLVEEVLPEIDPGDTAWVLTASALVLLMTPGLAFFYGGLVRRKNALATIMQSFIIIGLVSVQWVLWGYSLAFGPDIGGGLLGGLDWAGLMGVGTTPNAAYAATIPHQAFMVFQMMFAIITPALITGAFAERMGFKAFLFFTLLWATFVYNPIAHWVWSCTPIAGAEALAGCSGQPGWLRSLGALDFAGGTVVHISSGVSALVAAVVLGRRLGFGQGPLEPHDGTMVVLGASLLWFGWFGFNAGSALGAGELATSAFVVTHVAAAMAAITWMTMSWINKRHPSVLGAAAGAVAGLVAITPASGYVTPMAAILIGLGAGVFCYWAVSWIKHRIGVDDALDVWGVHGIGGTWGALATGLFATVAINSAGGNGLLYGNPAQLLWQAIAVGVTWVWAGVVTWVILKLVDVTVGLRVRAEDELAGLDASVHGEAAYAVEI